MTPCYNPYTNEVLDLEYDGALGEWCLPETTSELGTYPRPVPKVQPLVPRNLPYGENSSFIEGTTFQYAWDSVSFGLLKTCPRKYQLEIIEGYQPPSMAPPLIFGIYFHSLMQTYYQLLADGMEWELAVLRTAKLAFLFGKYLPYGDTARSKETLVRAFVWYTEQFKKDPAKTLLLPSGKPAVEVSFQIPFGQLGNHTLYLCGHIDRLVKFQGGVYFSDYKTTKYQLDSRFFDGFNPSNQMSIYRIASDIILSEPCAGGIVDGVQLGVNFCRYQRHLLEPQPERVEEDIKDLQTWIKHAADFASDNYWPKNEESCSKYSGCQFRSICAMSPLRRKVYLDGKFTRRNWDPLVPR